MAGVSVQARLKALHRLYQASPTSRTGRQKRLFSRFCRAGGLDV